MKIKRPSVQGMKNVSYLGRFQRDKFIQDGHNSGPKTPRDVLMNKDDSMGGGGGGGSPRGARGRPSGARNIETPQTSEWEVAEQKRISSGLKRDSIQQKQGELYKNAEKKANKESFNEFILRNSRHKSLNKEFHEADDEYRKNWLDAFKKRK